MTAAEGVSDWELSDCDEELLAFLTEQAAVLQGRAYHQMTPPEARVAYRAVCATRALPPGDRPVVGAVMDVEVDVHGDPMPMRVTAPVGSGPSPVVVFFHGGGWVFGDIDTYDDIARMICHEADVVVVNVGYPLSPEQGFPTPLDGCMAAVRWVADNAHSFGGDPSRIVVMGDSAGGNLAAATALQCRRAGIPLAGQVILYAPLVHVDHADAAGLTPWERRRQRFGPTLASTTWYWTNYVADPTTGLDPRASVLLEPDLADVAPAVVAYGDLDTFGEECAAYADRLLAAGVPVTLMSFPRIGHGFLAHGPMLPGQGSSAARSAALEVCAHLRQLAHGGRMHAAG
jgi:acetyl esterase